MDLTFRCSHCQQELAVDASAAGQTIQCPTCNAEIAVPQPDVANVHSPNAIASSAAAKIERHFSVPVHDAPAEILITTAKKVEEAEVDAGPKKMKIRVIRHTDCIEVGHDRYEEMVASFLNKVGEPNIISITPINYTHIDIATQKILTDYAVQVIYRG
jgi:DNA-directed RNA polymerase subunit RPC12/RpoP